MSNGEHTIKVKVNHPVEVDSNFNSTTDVDVYQISKSLTEGQFSDLLEDFLNTLNGDYTRGQRIGRMLHHSHRTLQGMAIRFALGLITGLGEQQFTDARNEKGIALGKKLKKMLDNHELDMGYLI